jgi:hypothetical protein
LQKAVVEEQITNYLAAHQCCGDCGEPLLHKGSHQITFRTLFGNLVIESPRLFHCKCRSHGKRTFSPLTELLPEHVAPERLYLETKWASLISFELAGKLLGEALPIQERVNGTTVRRHLHEVAARSEAALGEEQFSFITGCPREWKALPQPPAPMTVGIDGGFVRDWEDNPPMVGAQVTCPHCGAPNPNLGRIEEIIAFVCSHCGAGVQVEPPKIQ